MGIRCLEKTLCDIPRIPGHQRRGQENGERRGGTGLPVTQETFDNSVHTRMRLTDKDRPFLSIRPVKRG